MQSPETVFYKGRPGREGRVLCGFSRLIKLTFKVPFIWAAVLFVSWPRKLFLGPRLEFLCVCLSCGVRLIWLACGSPPWTLWPGSCRLNKQGPSLLGITEMWPWSILYKALVFHWLLSIQAACVCVTILLASSRYSWEVVFHQLTRQHAYLCNYIPQSWSFDLI